MKKAVSTGDDDSEKIGRWRCRRKKFRKPSGILVGDPRGLEASI